MITYLGSASFAAKYKVSRTVNEPTSASSCSTYELSLRNVFSVVGELLTRTSASIVAFGMAARCAKMFRSVVLPEPLSPIR